jgi:TolB-like protein/Tfp pilus assembly protein PilF
VKLTASDLRNVRFSVDAYKVVMPWERGEPQKETNARYDSHRVAVLPLVNMISDPTQEYFADGMTEELISAVSKVPELSVISRMSVMGYKNQTKHAVEISRELNVGTLLEGSVRKAGNRVRVAVQLIDANSDRHLWAENYDRNLEDVFAIQSEIAQNVAATLKIRLLQGDAEHIGRAPTTDPLAHDYYMKGRSHMLEGSEKELMTALGYFEQAVREDPRYATPYAYMALIYWDLAFHEMMPSRNAFEQVENLAKKAIELDESSADAHLVMGTVRGYYMDFAGQMREVQRALELDPNSVNAHMIAGNIFVFTKQFEKAQFEIQKMLELDPLSVRTITDAATQYLYSGETDKAMELYQKAISMDPRNSFARGNLGICHVRKGLYDKGVAEIEEGIEMESGGSPNALADLPYALSRAGRLEKAKKVVAELVRRYEEHGTGAASVARGYAAIGEKDKTLEWMEKAFNEHALMLRSFSVDFNFEDMQSDPRFQAFLKRLGLDIA